MVAKKKVKKVSKKNDNDFDVGDSFFVLFSFGVFVLCQIVYFMDNETVTEDLLDEICENEFGTGYKYYDDNNAKTIKCVPEVDPGVVSFIDLNSGAKDCISTRNSSYEVC